MSNGYFVKGEGKVQVCILHAIMVPLQTPAIPENEHTGIHRNKQLNCIHDTGTVLCQNYCRILSAFQSMLPVTCLLCVFKEVLRVH